MEDEKDGAADENTRLLKMVLGGSTDGPSIKRYELVSCSATVKDVSSLTALL